MSRPDAVITGTMPKQLPPHLACAIDEPVEPSKCRNAEESNGCGPDESAVGMNHLFDGEGQPSTEFDSAVHS